jgi:site-specific recombinase XerD
MNQYLEQFVSFLQTQDRSHHTITAYRRDVTAFFIWLREQIDQEVPLKEITAFDIQKYRDHLVALGRKPAGVNRRLAALRAFFGWAVKTGVIAFNPVAEVKGVRQGRRIPKALSAREVYKLQWAAATQRQLAEASDGNSDVTPTVVNARRDEALLNLLIYTGLRVGEVADLLLEDVVLNDRSGKVIVRSGKGRKHREIPLHREARKALAAYLEVRPQGQDGRFFLGQRGSLGPRGIQMRLAALGESAGVKVTPHMLRHTFATRLLHEVDADLVTVAALLGHSSVATTAIYAQPGEADLAEAVDGLT